MAAVPFGFSFGDFVAGIEVIHKAAQALRRSSGAQRDYHQAIADLESLETVLRKISALPPTTANQDTVQAIRACAYTCSLPLDRFVRRIRKYEEHLSWPSSPRGPLSKKATGSFWKVKWALLVEEDVAKLKASIEPLLGCVNALLHVEAIDRNATSHQEQQHALDCVKETLSRIESSWSSFKNTAASRSQIDHLTSQLAPSVQQALQKSSLSETYDRVCRLEYRSEDISERVDLTATRDQVGQLISMSQTADDTRDMNHHQLLDAGQHHADHLLQIDHKLDLVLALVNAQPLVTPHSRGHADKKPRVAKEGLDELYQRQTRSIASGMIRHGATNTENSVTQKRTHLSPQVQAILDMIRGILCSLAVALASLLPTIRAHWHTGLVLLKTPLLLAGNSIVLNDALERKKLLPYDYFSNWNVFKVWLEDTFKGLPGGSRVESGEFNLSLWSANTIGPDVDQLTWSHALRPGMEVAMFVVVRSRWHYSSCTACGKYEMWRPSDTSCHHSGSAASLPLQWTASREDLQYNAENAIFDSEDAFLKQLYFPAGDGFAKTHKATRKRNRKNLKMLDAKMRAVKEFYDSPTAAASW